MHALTLISSTLNKLWKTSVTLLLRRRPSQMWGRVFDLSKKKLVQLDGFKLFVMPDDYIGASILREKTYEAHVTKLVVSILSQGDTFLDVGANVGYYSLLASTLVKNNGRVIAFEPNPQNQQLIYASLLENDAKIQLYPYAVSDSEAILKFTTVGSNGGVVTEHSKDQKFFFRVQSVVLDDVLKDESRIDLVKIDVEAHEPHVLKGMEKLLVKFKPRIITEFHPWALKLNNPEPPETFLYSLIAMGYTLSIIKPAGGLEKLGSVEEIMDYYRSLGKETAHLDIFAEPA